MGFGIFAILFIALCIIVGRKNMILAYNDTDNSDEEKLALNPNAKIKSVTYSTAGIKGHKKILTIIEYDDGYKFTSPRCDRTNRLLSYTLSVDKNMIDSLILDSKKAHLDACIERNLCDIPCKNDYIVIMPDDIDKFNNPQKDLFF